MGDSRGCDPSEINGAVYAGEIPSSVAGWHFHQAPAFPGDWVRLVREPGNPHDTNAIAVHNTHGQRIGYLPRRQAAILAPRVDSRAISLAGRLLNPGEAGFDEEIAQTRPPMMIYVFQNAAAGSSIPIGRAVPSGDTRTELESTADGIHNPGEIDIPF